MKEKGRLANKIAVITGGSQGIGKGIALEFLKEGARVALADWDTEAGHETTAEFGQLFGSDSVAFYACDVSREKDVDFVTEQVLANWGRVDILVNNAGLSEFKSLDDISVEEFERVIDVNLKGAFICAKRLSPHLKQSCGAMLNIASTRALMSEKGSEAYAASKGGLLSLTHALAISLGPAVRVNAISPGWIEVGDWKKQALRVEPLHSEADQLQHPVGRVGVPGDIGKAAVFLCSDEAGFITGQNIVIDGGMTVKMIYD